MTLKNLDPGPKPNENDFVAKPSEDLPKNRLTDKLARGLQNYVQRVQKRECIRVKIQVQPHLKGYGPQPRENGTLTSCGMESYLIGGMSRENIKTIQVATIEYSKVVWRAYQFVLDDPHFNL